jgi:methylated-DNA-[protein]-cysteine S-methyltransferase
MTESLVYKFMRSPVGRLKLIASDRGLVAILWAADEKNGRVSLPLAEKQDRHPVFVETEKQLKEYFSGRRKRFSVKLDLRGTPFQKKVWRALLKIPHGETRTYGEIARQLGHPNGARAVGAANGRNPISIIAPCHRLVGSTGKLHGFAGGLKAKADLLKLEGASPLSLPGLTRQSIGWRNKVKRKRGCPGQARA